MSFDTMSNFAGSWNPTQNTPQTPHVHFSPSTRQAPGSATSNQSGTSHRGRVPQRKPVGSGSRPTTPRHDPSVPPRKPVGSGSAAPSMNSRTQSPAASGSKTPLNLNKPLPPAPRNEHMRATGKDQARMPQPSEWSKKTNVEYEYDIPGGGRKMVQSPLNHSRSTTPSGASRPSSSGGWSFMSRKRTNSNASSVEEVGSSSKPRSNSITSVAKKTGKWVTGTAGIMAMTARERDDFRKASLDHKAKQRELERQQNPSTRPMHEKRFLLGLSKDDSRVFTAAAFAAQLEDRVSRERRSTDLKRRHERDCAQALRQGRPRPDTPEGVRLSPRKDSMNSLEREKSLECRSHEDLRDADAGLDLSERVAFKLSRKLDALKSQQPKRKGSDSSDMDFADSAPADQAFECGKCGNYSLKYLKAGLCESCYLYRKNTDPRIRSQTNTLDAREPSLGTRKKGHNPISPEDDAHGGDLYIRLPAQHRLRKVRGTIYADPGNPFEIDTFEASLLPSTTYGQDSDVGTDSSDALNYQEPEAMQSSGRSQMTSMFSDPFDLVNIHETSPSRRESLSSFPSTRRSMSVDIGFLPIQDTEELNEHFETEQSWSDHAPVLHIPRPSGTVFTTSSKRDTQFYEFYDDLLAEYGVEHKDTTHHMQHMLPVRF